MKKHGTAEGLRPMEASLRRRTPPSFHVGDLPGQVPRVLNQVSRDPWRTAGSGTGTIRAVKGDAETWAKISNR